MHRPYRAIEFRKFLNTIDAAVRAELTVHLILDDYGTHKTPLLHRWLARHPRFRLHFTPTSASWLKLVERWFALLSAKQIRPSDPEWCPESSPAGRARAWAGFHVRRWRHRAVGASCRRRSAPPSFHGSSARARRCGRSSATKTSPRPTARS